MNMEITFTGEESARFAKFAISALEAGITLSVRVEGREPLTSRPVQLKGKVINATLDGYLRHLVMLDEGSQIEHWIAGSNSTRSIASKTVTFIIDEKDWHQLQGFARARHIFVPIVSRGDTHFDPILAKIDEALEGKNDLCTLDFLLKQLQNENELIATESALCLRAFASLMTSDSLIQNDAESKMMEVLKSTKILNARIALAENLGYIGTHRCIPVLAKLLADQREHNHVRWAAAIALGRLPDASVVDVLLQGLKNSHLWTVAATLLSLSRRADSQNQSVLDPVFFSYLSTEIDPLLKRYACLGLSKFEKLSTMVLTSLCDIIGDQRTSLDVRGYACLAISSSLLDSSIEFHKQVGLRLEAISKEAILKGFILKYMYCLKPNENQCIKNGAVKDVFRKAFEVNRVPLTSDLVISQKEENTWEVVDRTTTYRIKYNSTELFIYTYTFTKSEPELMWGMEFMAELATLLEQYKTAAVFHSMMAKEFKDWRSKYYESLSLYDTAEDAVRQGNRDEVIELFHGAYKELQNLATLPDEAFEIVSFRRDILKARLCLHSIINTWEDVLNPQDFDSLIDQLHDVAKIYTRYTSQPRRSMGIKNLSERELRYIRATRKLVDVICLLLSLDSNLRRGPCTIADLQTQIEIIVEGLMPLDKDFSNSLARSLHSLVKDVTRRIRAIQDLLTSKNVPPADKLRGIRGLLSEIRTLFSRTTWPMPARTCPVSGLGRGTIKILKEDIPGEGTEKFPYMFLPDTPAILNVVAEIYEMAPGGATVGQVVCDIAGKELVSIIPVAEGPCRISLNLSDVLSPVTSTQCRIALRFESRDCNQTSHEITIYVRRGR